MMDERARRVGFLALFAVGVFHLGAHTGQAFVNYPAWRFIGAESFPAYHRVMTSGALRWLLLPRVVELILAALVLRFPPAPLKRWPLALTSALALGALVSTIAIQRPIHVQLESLGNTPDLLARLEVSDWLRQGLEWSRAGLYLWMAVVLLCPPLRGGPNGQRRSHLLLVAAGIGLGASPRGGGVMAAPPPALTEFLGTWRGSSVCVDRIIAPACRDGTIVYEVRRGAKAETATLKADKIVDGERAPMGEFDFAYNATEACWRAEFETPRFHGAWCLVVEGKRMTGTLRLLPDKAVVRRVELTRDEARPGLGGP